MSEIYFVIISGILLGAYSSSHHVNGWYPVADVPENRIEGNAIVTVEDIDVVSLDTVSYFDIAVIKGRLKVDQVQTWSVATESRTGKRIGFVFNDSVITAPTINCRIESGGFTINNPDKTLILKTYNILNKF